MVLRLSVPAGGELRTIAADLAVKIAEHFGAAAPDAAAVTEALDRLTGAVGSYGSEVNVHVEFRRSGHELIMEAQCQGQSSELRYSLPA